MKLYPFLILLAVFLLLLHPASNTKLIKKILKAKFLLKRGFGGKGGRGGGSPTMVHFVIPLMPPFGGLMSGGLRGNSNSNSNSNNNNNNQNSNNNNNNQNSNNNNNNNNDGGFSLFRGGHRKGNSIRFPFVISNQHDNSNNQDCYQQQQLRLMHMFQQQQRQQQQHHQMFHPPSVNHFRPQEPFSQLPIEQQTLESSIVQHRPGKLNHHRHRHQQSEGIKSRAQEEVVQQQQQQPQQQPPALVGQQVTSPQKNGWVEPVFIMMDLDHGHHGEEGKPESFANVAEEDRQQIASPREPLPLQQGVVAPDNSFYQSEMEPEATLEDIDQHHQQPSFPAPQPFSVADGMKM